MDSTLLWTIIGTGLGTTIAVVSITISLWLHSDAKTEKFQEAIKDFHARLAVQDSEFKAHMTYYHSVKE
jgi:hypothetical protein